MNLCIARAPNSERSIFLIKLFRTVGLVLLKSNCLQTRRGKLYLDLCPDLSTYQSNFYTVYALLLYSVESVVEGQE